MKKLIVPLLILPLVLPFHIGNTLGVTGTIVSGEKKIIKKTPRANKTQLMHTQLLNKLTSVQSEIQTLRQKKRIVQTRIERKIRMRVAHTIDDASLENLMKQIADAEKTRAEIQKKLEDTASGAIQKIG